MFTSTYDVNCVANISEPWRSGRSAVKRPLVAFCLLFLAPWIVVGEEAEPQKGRPAASASVWGPVAPRDRSGENSSAGAGRADDAAALLKVRRYVDRLLDKYDHNGDRRLQSAEWQRMQGSPSQADFDNNGLITRQELIRHVAGFGRWRRIRPLRAPFWNEEAIEPLLNPKTESAASENADPATALSRDDPAAAGSESPASSAIDEPIRQQRRFFVRPSQLPAELPGWFDSRDLNGDGQVTMAEFAPRTDTRLQQFKQLDLNGDGLITTAECLRAAKTAKKGPTP